MGRERPDCEYALVVHMDNDKFSGPPGVNQGRSQDNWKKGG